MQELTIPFHNIKIMIFPVIFSLLLNQATGMEDSAPESSVGREFPARLHYLEMPMAFEQGLKPLPLNSAQQTSWGRIEDGRQFADQVNTLGQYNSSLALIEEASGPWDSGLTEQLLMVGSLEQEQGNHIEAIKSLSRAVHISRITNGLYTLDQVAALEKIIDSYIAVENWQDADLYQNYLFFIEHRAYGASDSRIISSLERLALWNMEMFAIGFGEALGVRLSNAQMLQNLSLIHISEPTRPY